MQNDPFFVRLIPVDMVDFVDTKAADGLLYGVYTYTALFQRLS